MATERIILVQPDRLDQTYLILLAWTYSRTKEFLKDTTSYVRDHVDWPEAPVLHGEHVIGEHTRWHQIRRHTVTPSHSYAL